MSLEVNSYEFRCPKCHETIEVNASMRSTLLEKGCVLCGAAVSTRAFDEV